MDEKIDFKFIIIIVLIIILIVLLSSNRENFEETQNIEIITPENIVPIQSEEISSEEYMSSKPSSVTLLLGDEENIELEIVEPVDKQKKLLEEKTNEVLKEKENILKLNNEFLEYKKTCEDNLSKQKDESVQNNLRYNNLNTEYINYKTAQTAKYDTDIMKAQKECQDKVIEASSSCDKRIKNELEEQKTACINSRTELENKLNNQINLAKMECTNKIDKVNGEWNVKIKETETKAEKKLNDMLFMSYEKGILFGVYDGYYNGNVNIGSTSKLSEKFGPISYGLSNDLNNINNATNKIIPKYFTKAYGPYSIEWLGLIYTGDQEGKWIIEISSDDTIMIWINDYAFVNYNKNNTFLFSDKKGKIESESIKLLANRFYPIRILYSSKNGQDSDINVNVKYPNGSLATDIYYSFKR